MTTAGGAPSPGVEVRDRSVNELLGQLAARVPAPGGGVTAALHAAQAAALLAMVSRYTTGERFSEHTDVVTTCTARADLHRSRSLELAEQDEAAFTAVSDAYRMPKETPGDKKARSAAIGFAVGKAAEPPAEVIRTAAHLIAIAETLLPVCNKNVITDVAAASDAARAAATTARVNVEINLAGIVDHALRYRLGVAVAKVDDIATRADRITDMVRAQLN